MSPLLYLFTRWAAYQQMTPEQQALEDADRFLPTHETIRLLQWWWQNPTATCPTCRHDFEWDRYGDRNPIYCSKRCATRAAYVRYIARHGRTPRYRCRIDNQ